MDGSFFGGRLFGVEPYDVCGMPEFSGQFRSRDWPNASIPDAAAGVYAVGGTQANSLRYLRPRHGRRVTAGRRFGLWTRIASYASGRLSGGQLCVYVAKRHVVPELKPMELPLLASGELNLDALTKRYITEHFSYSFALTTSSRAAPDLEQVARRGFTFGVKPTLNPLA
jgi:hypothetical protein